MWVFLKKIRKWHECTVCDNILLANSGFTKRNETFTMAKKFTESSNLHNVSQPFHFYVTQCEKAVVKQFDSCSFEHDIGTKLVDGVKCVYTPFKCIGFPTYKFFIFFVRVRIYYLLKFYNATVASAPKNKTKDFSHK